MHIKIDDTAKDQRFDRFLRKYFKPYGEIRLSDIFSWIRKWAIKVNMRKQKENYRLQRWDVVAWDDSIVTDLNAKDAKRSKKEKILHYPLEDAKQIILQENTNWLIFNKPPRLVMHPGTKHGHDLSLHDIMKSYLLQTEQQLASETFHPSFCFRLDKDTSGVVIAAKTYEALQSLNEQIRERKTNKTYVAVVLWTAPDQWTIEAPLFKWFDRASWKAKMFINKQKWVEAKTSFTTKKYRDHPVLWPISLIEVELYTWRMHQIRIHMASLWHPILWDITYWDAPSNRITNKELQIHRQLLHSRKYWFFDIFKDTRTSITTDIPEQFTALFTP